MEEDDNVVVVVDGGGVVPSLVVTGDFPSWDWTDQASMLTSSATGSFSDDLSTTAAAATQAQAARIGNANASTTKTTTTTTATTPSATTTTTTTSSSSSSTIQVLVAGIPYSVPLSLVPRLSQLPWERNRSLPTLCPRLFEIVLHHLLFQALPNLSKLPDGDTEELETLALLLDLPDLEKHVTRGSGGGGGGRTNDGSRRGRGSRYCHPSRQAPPPLGEEEEGLPPIHWRTFGFGRARIPTDGVQTIFVSDDTKGAPLPFATHVRVPNAPGERLFFPQTPPHTLAMVITDGVRIDGLY